MQKVFNKPEILFNLRNPPNCTEKYRRKIRGLVSSDSDYGDVYCSTLKLNFY